MTLFHDDNANAKNKQPIHPSIDPYFNEEYHFLYSSLHNLSLTRPWYNRSIRAIFKMAGTPAEPPLSTNARNNYDSVDIINLQFVQTALANQSRNSDTNLVHSLKTALRNADWDSSDIDAVLGGYDPKITVRDFYCQMDYLAVVKAKGRIPIKKERKRERERERERVRKRESEKERVRKRE